MASAALAALAMQTPAIANTLPTSPPDVVFPNVSGGFQLDGNFDQPTYNPAPPDGSIDWTNVNAPPNPFFRDPIGTSDLTVYSGSGSKETLPVAGWQGNGTAGAPQKGDFGNIFYAANVYDVDPTAAVDNHVVMFFGYERAFNSGSLDISVELNQLANQLNGNGVSVPTRTAGDIRLVIENSGAQNLEIVGDYAVWDPTLNGGLGDWGAGASLGTNIVGRLNDANIADPYDSDLAGPATGTVPLQQFVEFGVDMTGAGLIPAGCPLTHYFDTLNLRARSGPSISDGLLDFATTSIFTPTLCTDLRIEKHNTDGVLLAGATFQVTPNPNTGSGSLTAVDGGANDLTTVGTQAPADGVIEFFQAQPLGNYTVTETVPPPGYAPAAPQTKNCPAGGSCTFTFVDTVQTVGYLRLVKQLVDAQNNPVTPADPSVLNGTTFVVYQDTSGNGSLDPGEQAHIFGTANVATCTISNSLGYCDIGPLATGSYRVTETVAPANTQSAGDVDATVIETNSTSPTAVSFTNVVQALNITLDKTGPTTANVGDTFTYTFTASTTGPRLHNIVLTDTSNLCDAAPAFQSGDDGDGFLEAGESWVWTCQHTVTLSDPDPLPNQASISGTDDFGGPVSDTDTFSVDILHPDLTVTKTAPNDPVTAGDPASFTMTLTVGGEVGSIARSVTLTDPLPGGLTWVMNPAVGGCGIQNGTLSCSFGDLPFGATRTVTVEAVTASDTCGATLTNLVVVGATNELTTDNNSASAAIAVNCADVTVTKTADVSPIAAGASAAYTITVSSSGGTARNVTLTDALPSGVTWAINPAVPGCGIFNGALACTFDSVAPGAPVTIHISGATDTADCGLLANTAIVAAGNESAGATANNSATATIEVQCPIGISVSNAGPPAVHVGDTITFQMTVANTQLTPFTSVLLTNAACDSGTLALVTDGDGDSVLGVGESWVYACTHVVLAGDADPLVSVASVVGIAADARTASDTSTWTVDIAHPSIALTMTASPNPVHLGHLVTVSYLVTNTGDTTLVNIAVTDDKFGLIGTAASLGAGQSVVFTRTIRATPTGRVTHVGAVTAQDTVPTNVTVTGSAQVTIRTIPAGGHRH